MQIVTTSITVKELNDMAYAMFGNLVKGVVDIEKGILAIDAPMHSDLEAELLRLGSKQNNLWGINLHPNNFGNDNFIEYDSVINLRPHQDNNSRSVESTVTRKLIAKIIANLIRQ